MSGPVIFALVWLAGLIGISALTWRNSPKFRAAYPQFQSGPFWACLSGLTMFFGSRSLSTISKAIFGSRFGMESWQVYAIAGVPLLIGFFLINLVIPQTRRAIVAFDQHLMGKAVTGRLFPGRDAS